MNADKAWWPLHESACARGESTYRDPETGYRVFTSVGLDRRGRCCGCGCRHCPYGHSDVSDRAARIKQPAFLHRRQARISEPERRHVLSWSGGKDSLLALRAWIRDQCAASNQSVAEILDSLVLLTTFDAASRVVAHQEIAIADVERQSRALDLDLVATPLHAGVSYRQQLVAGLDRVRAGEGSNQSRFEVASLIFGDLHLAHVRAWRDAELENLASCLEYPLWQTATDVLMADLIASGVPCLLSACPGGANGSMVDGVDVGSRFDRDLATRALAAGWDAFGENSEFHTMAYVWMVSSARALGVE